MEIGVSFLFITVFTNVVNVIICFLSLMLIYVTLQIKYRRKEVNNTNCYCKSNIITTNKL